MLTFSRDGVILVAMAFFSTAVCFGEDEAVEVEKGVEEEIS